MSERVIPGVSIKEVTEGLIGVPSTGAVNVKLVGTACKGDFAPHYFEDFKSVQDYYGAIDPHHYSVNTGTNPAQELTLVRAASLIFNNRSTPAGGVWCCRVGESAESLEATGVAVTTTGVLTMYAQEPGSWFNEFQYQVEDGVTLDGSVNTNYSVFRLQIPRIDIIDTNISLATDSGRGYGLAMTHVGDSQKTIAVQFDSLDVDSLVAVWNTSPYTSYFTFGMTVTGQAITETLVWTPIIATTLTTDTIGRNWSASDTASPSTSDYNTALEKLRDKKDCYLTIIAGCDGDSSGNYSGVPTVGLAHANLCASENNEQSFIFGSEKNTSRSTLVSSLETGSGYNIGDYRCIKVAPGVTVGNPFRNIGSAVGWSLNTNIFSDPNYDLSGGYGACVVAGIIMSNVPDESPMNKSVTVDGLEHDFPLIEQKTLTRENFFLLYNAGNSYRTLRDLTCGGSGSPFQHVSTRMALDEIRRAIRLAGQPWIGRKNILRNRDGLRDSLDFVLQERVAREIILPTYSLEVTSTRDEQIIGVVKVTMIIQLVFYMEFIEVELILE